jgi:diguanylate cyclase (GGDEF)-like protein/PAS domain S-box-containing protein
MAAPIPENEELRLAALRSYCVLDSPPEPIFDHLTRIGAALFQVPVVLISLVDEHRQFFKSVTGLDLTSSPRRSSFCAYTILGKDALVVLDTRKDDRFRDNELVIGAPYIRFYAGAPLITRSGHRLGSFCVIGQQPRESFGQAEQSLLATFAALTIEALENRLFPAKLTEVEKTLEETQERLQLATQATADGIWDFNCETRQVFYSARLRSLIGFPEKDHIGTLEDWISRLHPDDAQTARVNIQQLKNSARSHFESEYRIRHIDGSWRWMQNRGIAIRRTGTQVTRMVGSVSDITERKAKDALTGLYTRAAFLNAVDWRMREAEEHRRSYAVLFLDIDHFKRFNDSFGHEAGNCVITEMARRIKATLNGTSGNLAARLTGDEFGILLPDVGSPEDAQTYAQCLEHIFQVPIQCGTCEITASASIGIVVGDASYSKAEHLLHDADLSMHEAKLKGRRQSVLFDRSQRERVLAKVTLESELRRALERNELRLHYQPKIQLSTGEIVGFEALIRWQHPTRGLLSPYHFISLAEESDLIIEVGRFTLRESIRQLSEWRRVGLVKPHITMAANLSARQFTDNQLVSIIQRELSVYELPPSCFELEVTEGVLIRNSEATLEILRGLKALGASLALDDFGTGYSSLSYLQRLPFDCLKIDRSFVAELGTEHDSTAIVEAILSLGRALNLSMVAEGIETYEQAKRLESLGCCFAQGFLFSHPLSGEVIAKRLEQRWSRPADQAYNVWQPESNDRPVRLNPRG